jgi:hypothetical protein
MRSSICSGIVGSSGHKRKRPDGSGKKQAAGLTRDQTIQKYKGHLMEYGFADSELLALFNADKRTEMNSAAHQMKINEMIASLGA